MVGHVSICWDYVSIFIYKNSNYNKTNQVQQQSVFKTVHKFLQSGYPTISKLIRIPGKAFTILTVVRWRGKILKVQQYIPTVPK